MNERSLLIDDRSKAIDDVLNDAARAAAAFKSLGIGEDDCVGLLLRNDFPAIEAMHAATAVGAYVVPYNWHAKADELAYLIDDSRPKLLVVHDDLVASLPALPPSLPIVRVATRGESSDETGREWSQWIAKFEPWTGQSATARNPIIYTSGTTGRPKGVRRQPMSAEQRHAYSAIYASIYGFRPGMRAYVGGPLYHSTPVAFSRHALPIADLLVLQQKFDAETLLQLIDSRRLTHLALVPTMMVRMLRLPEEVRRKYDLSSLESVVHTAAPCPPDVKKAMIDWVGPIVGEIYGSTELGAAVFCGASDWLDHPGTVGRAVDGAEIRILDEADRQVAPGTIGEVYIRMNWFPDFTYHGKDEQRREIERDGFVTSGDIGFLDEEGFLYLSDRKKDVIISGGVNIYPAEIEHVIQAIPGVSDCAVFGIPDDEFGEAVMAVIEPAPGAVLERAEVEAFLREKLSGFKVPRHYEFTVGLPREDSGKLMKRKLRDPYWAGRNARI